MLWKIFGKNIKNKYLLWMYLLGVLFVMIGAYMKLEKVENANVFLMIALYIKIEVVLALVHKYFLNIVGFLRK